MNTEWKNVWLVQIKNAEGMWQNITKKPMRFGKKEYAQNIVETFVKSKIVRPENIRIQVVVTKM